MGDAERYGNAEFLELVRTAGFSSPHFFTKCGATLLFEETKSFTTRNLTTEGGTTETSEKTPLTSEKTPTKPKTRRKNMLHKKSIILVNNGPATEEAKKKLSREDKLLYPLLLNRAIESNDMDQVRRMLNA